MTEEQERARGSWNLTLLEEVKAAEAHSRMLASKYPENPEVPVIMGLHLKGTADLLADVAVKLERFKAVQPFNDPAPLPAPLLDKVAQWARLDGEMMVSEGAKWDRLYAERWRMADIIARRLLDELQDRAVSGDLATALAERSKYYAEYRAAHEQTQQGKEPI